jgi:hypothetical protein
MVRMQICSDLSFIPPDASVPFVLHRTSKSHGLNVDSSLIFRNRSGNTWRITGVSHNWGQFTFRHVGSIWGRPPEIRTKLIVNN